MIKKTESEYNVQNAVMMYLPTQVMNEAEKEKYQKAFAQMDKNGDGKLSREELFNGFASLNNSSAIAAGKANQILENLDADKSGFIGYSEFLMAMVDTDNMLSDKNLRQAFNAFDKDRNGFIAIDEIKILL